MPQSERTELPDPTVVHSFPGEGEGEGSWQLATYLFRCPAYGCGDETSDAAVDLLGDRFSIQLHVMKIEERRRRAKELAGRLALFGGTRPRATGSMRVSRLTSVNAYFEKKLCDAQGFGF